MTVPSATPPRADATNSKILRAAIWVAIGALIAAAVVCVVMVLVGTANGIVPRAFLTILLMVAFAAVALMDTYLAPRRPVWFALTSMAVWIVTLLIGAVMIWLPFGVVSDSFGNGAGRFFAFLLIVLILQLAVLHVRLFVKAWERHRTTFTSIVVWVTIALVALLAVMLVAPLIVREFVRFHDLYWRLTVAVAILAAVGTALVPLVNALFAPRRTHPQPAHPGWPTYADGITPLPVLADGQPDWNAYYTGHPTVPQAGIAPQAAAAQTWAAPEQAPAVAPQQAAPAWPAPSWPAPDWPAPMPPGPGAAPQHPAPEPPAAAPAAERAPQPQTPPQPATPEQAPPPPAPGHEGYPPPPAPPHQH